MTGGLRQGAGDQFKILPGRSQPLREPAHDTVGEVGATKNIPIEQPGQRGLRLGDGGGAQPQFRPEGGFIGTNQGDGTGVGHRLTHSFP